jgi:proline iminopeptidase
MKLSVAALMLFTAACVEKKAAPAPDSATASATDTTKHSLLPGEAYLAVPEGKIWYRVVGNGGGTPVILLHGGPGFGSYYMKPLEALSADRPVVRYDQLGGGASGAFTDTTKMTIAHFVAELDSLRSSLHYHKVHLLGHSWGTILAVEYYRAHPEHVASLTLASPALDVPEWERHTRELEKTLSDSSQRAIAKGEHDKNFESPAYQNAINEFYGKYVWLRPDSVNLDSTFKTANMTIYNYMQGPSEFTITGTLKRYDAKPFLKDIKVPVLFTVGEFDEANPVTVKKHAAMTPGARYYMIPNAAHLSEWDNPTAMNQAIGTFLKDVDAKSKKN